MLTEEDIKLAQEAAGISGLKLIFLGDPKQIPAVVPNAKRKPLSPVFTVSNKSTLTKVYRTDDTELLSLLTKIRNNSEFVNYITKDSDNLKFLYK